MSKTRIENGVAVTRSDADDAALYPPPPPPATPSAADLVAYAADKRWRVHTGGIVFQGIPIATDADSKTLIIGMRLRADKDPTVTEDFAAADGSIHSIDAATIMAVSDAVADHVSAAFTTFTTVAAAISAGTITTTAQVDAASWPPNS